MKSCSMESVVDAHFAGSIGPAKEVELRAHLETCDRCRLRYQRRLMLSRLDPEAPPAQERLGRALGLTPARRSRSPLRNLRTLFASIGAVAAAAAFALYAMSPSTTDGFAARGSVDADLSSPRIEVFRTTQGAPPERAEGSIRASDELAFAYVNPSTKTHVLVFGVDEHGHVFWYHPAWSDAALDPAAIRVEADGNHHELREAVAHALDGDKLEVHGLFASRAMTVKEVERIVAGRSAPLGALVVPGATDTIITFSVAP